MTSLSTIAAGSSKKYSGVRRAHAPAPSLLTHAKKNVGYGEAVLDFAEQRRSKGNKPHSLQTVLSKLHKFGLWLAEKNLGLPDVREALLDKYMVYRADVDSVGDIARHSDGVQIKAFIRHSARRGFITTDYLKEWTPPKHDKPFRKMPAPEEIIRLLKAVEDKCKPDNNPCRRHRNRSSQSFYTTRDQAIVSVAVCCGLRPAEIFALRLDDYNKANKQIVVRHSKSGEPRYLPISEFLISFVDTWLKHRPDERILRELECWQEEDEFGKLLRPSLFLTEGGAPMSVSSWSRQFKRYCTWAGIEEMTPYNLRHFCLTKMAQTDPLAAQNQAGHSDLRTTMTYIHNSADHNRAAHTKADPLGQVMALLNPTQKRRKSLIRR